MGTNILDEIIRESRVRLEEKKKKFSMEWLGRSLSFNPFVPKNVKQYLTSTEDNKYRIIAELKKASPSRGVIKKDFNYLEIAQAYQNGGADSISVLTEEKFFQGNIQYIPEVRRYTNIPILRKDFIFDKYQILEALVYGADYILLIASILSRKELKTLVDYARHLGLDVLVEVHNKIELIKAIFSGSDIIGINHRNLEDFSIDLNLSKSLIPLIPNNKIIVAESGIKDKDTIIDLSKRGIDAFLIGEYFMKQTNIESSIKEIKNLNISYN